VCVCMCKCRVGVDVFCGMRGLIEFLEIYTVSLFSVYYVIISDHSVWKNS